MKAIFNESREILGIGQYIANEENRSDWIEISGGDEIDQNNMWADGEALYTIDESGVVSKNALADLKIKMAAIRMQRNAMLTSCDWTQVSDCPLSEEDKTSWANYRQSLRDLPQQEGFNPDSFEWPERPE